MCKRGIDASYINGDTHMDERNMVKQMFADGKIKVVVTTVIWKEGINVPIIDDLINASGEKSPTTLLQIFGRGLRTAKGKSKVYVYDFMDRDASILVDHTGMRKDIYEQDGFKPTIKHWKKLCV